MSDTDASNEPDDPYLWLEEVDGERARVWVQAQNAKTFAALCGPDFEREREDLRLLFSAPDKIPFITKRGEYLYNLWQDKNNLRGLWRRTTLESYRSSTPQWTTILDVDELGRREKENWVWGYSETLPPHHHRALVRLSRGGSDASVIREFNIEDRAFVADGFALAESKSAASWLDADTLLVTSPLGDGHATIPGYARTVRRWRRGTPFAAAETIYEGQENDFFICIKVDHDPGFERTLICRHLAFFEIEHILLDSKGRLHRIDVPSDSSLELHREWLTLQLHSPWRPKDREFAADSFLAIRLDAFMAGSRDFELLFAPGERRVIQASAWAGDRLAISVLDNMRSQILIAEPAAGGWRIERLADVPETDTAAIWCISGYEGSEAEEFLLNLTGFLRPTSLYIVEPAKAPALLKQSPNRFDASGLVVTQHEAVADDGVRIPYSQVAPADLPLDGDNPTILYGYGGFRSSSLPFYSTAHGKSWLERGGVYVNANIRGGSEFGSAWHKAGVREGKKRTHDDFAAVAIDLIRRGVTRRERLAAHGGSNGGLLVGNMLTRYPHLFGAVWCTVPVLDMRRYTKLLAGASWIAEYGDPDIPEDWAFIKEISPYHLAEAGRDYPPILLWTSARDDRVHPGHARKMAAKLEKFGYQVFFYEPAEGGHGTSDYEQQAHALALGYAFLRHTIGEPQRRGPSSAA
jgi:prolyl oligopeptidase